MDVPALGSLLGRWQESWRWESQEDADKLPHHEQARRRIVPLADGGGVLVLTRRLFGEIVRARNELASPRLQGGLNRRSVMWLLEEAMRDVYAGVPPSEAAEAVIAKVNATPVELVVVAEFRDIVNNRDFTIGQCTIRHEGHVVLDDRGAPHNLHLEPPTIATTVQAIEHDAAEMIGRERIAEARAILALADGRPQVVGEKVVTAQPGGIGHGARTSLDRVIAWNVVNEDSGQRPLIPGYHELSSAAAKPAERRNDLERRVLAAARWWHRASTTSWYAEAFSAAVASLEVLLLDDDHGVVEEGLPPSGGNSKASELHRRLRDALGPLNYFGSTREQREWIRSRYDDRSRILHGGTSTFDDRHAESLIEISGLACRWAIHHLDPFHRLPNGSCKTLAEALEEEADRRARREPDLRGVSQEQ